jgi:predicted DsbA family dithiol-disulfide isomerase
MSLRKPIRVEVWSDVACPWCWVGKRHLEEAVRSYQADGGGAVEVHWQAFELNPAAPKNVPSPVDYVDRLAAKYMTTRAGAQSMLDRMCEVGRTCDLEFRFDRVQPTNTFDAHRLLSWAHTVGVDLQGRLKEALFVAYMNRGDVVSDHETLIALAADAGLDPDGARAVLSSDAYSDQVRADESRAGELAVTGVPFFYIDGRVGVPGAQQPELLLQALNKAVELQLDPAADAAASCGPDGCPV